jgi:nitrate/nitrite transporter NarK
LFLLVLLHPVAGIVADRIGIRKLLILSATVMAIVVLPIFRWMETGSILAVSGGFVLLAIVFAPINAIGGLPLVLQFSPEIRGTAFSLSFNVAAVAFGGLAPLFADFVVHRTGKLSSCGVLLLIAAAVSIWAWATVKANTPAAKPPVPSALLSS